jgi:ferrous iron transport protein B
MEQAYLTSKTKRKGKTVLEGTALIHLIGDCKSALDRQGVENTLFHAVKLVELDEVEVKEHPNSAVMVEEFKKNFKDDTFGNDFEAIVADSRYKYISKNYSSVLTKKKIAANEKEKATKSDKIDKVLTHKAWGIPIFLVILFLIFHFTFSEDLFYLGAMGVFDKDVLAYDVNGQVVSVDEETFIESFTYYDEDGNLAELGFDDGELASVIAFPYVYLQNGEKVLLENAKAMENTIFYASENLKWEVTIEGEEGEYEIVFISGIDEFASEVTLYTFFGFQDGVFSPGVILFNTLDTFTGFLSASASEGLKVAGATDWVSGLVVDGILGGLFAVLSFLPQILLLFLFLSLLEDSGYMARVAFILDRIFRKFGLSGRAFMPMIMGFGCSIPAMINTRTLADQNERTATIRVIPFFSCGAKLPILTAIAGGIIQLVGVGNADLITYGMYLLGIIVAILSVLLMRNTSMKGEVPPFIMELPAYHIPSFKNLMLHLWDKTKHFIKKAFTIILASTIIIWFVSHFSWHWKFLSDAEMNESILAGIGGLVQPLFTPLGFGSQLGSWGWVFVVAAITGLVAKENVIATFGTLAACIVGTFINVEADGGVSAVMQMIESTGITVPALLAFIAFNMTTIPCFAAVATAKSELQSKKTYKNTLLFWICTSYIVAAMVYIIGSWWWTSFIFAAVWAFVITFIVLKNKGKIHIGKKIKAKV